MKILRLDLRAFGPFTDLALDLSAGQEGLHLIYGPNEAGKSTALRAIEQMLFGIPQRSTDDFLHPYKSLRVGGTLRSGDGREIEFLRRKATKGALLAGDNQTALAEDALRSCLGNLDREMFHQMFGLSHERLVAGGREIVHGQGDVGQLLFAAGSGVADLQAIRDRLDERAQELFTPRAQVRQINQKLKALEEAKRTLKQALLPTDEWVRHDQELTRARAERDRIVVRLQELQRQRRRLERVSQALPVLAKRRALQARRAELAEVRMLREGFTEQRSDVESELRAARREEQIAGEELDRICRELQTLVIPESVMAKAGRIAELPELLGSHRKAQRDVVARRAERAQFEADAAQILRQLRPDLSLEAAECLRLTSQQKRQIQNLGIRHGALIGQMEQATRDIEQSKGRVSLAEAELAGLAVAQDTRALAAAIRRARGHGDLQALHTAAREALRRAQEQAEVELARLDLWSGTIADLERLPVPSAETVDHYASELAGVSQRLDTIRERIEEAHKARRDTELQIEELRRQGEVPSEQDLDDARRVRELGWELILADWFHRPVGAGQRAEFLAHFDEGIELAAAYVQAVARADELADRLRRESQRVAQRAAFEAQLDAILRQLERLEEQVAATVALYDRLQHEWHEAWRPTGVEPRSPKEMRSWLRRCLNLVGQAEILRNQEREASQIAERIEAIRAELNERLVEIGELPGGTGELLPALLDRAEAAVNQSIQIATRRKELETEIRQLHERLATADAAADKARLDLAAWREQWTAALETLGLAADTEPAVANEVITRLDELFSRTDQIQSLTLRIDQIGHDADAFRADVERLAREVDEGLLAPAVEQTAERLIARLRKTEEDRQRQQDLLQRQKRQEQTRQEKRRRIAILEDTLKTLCQEAGVERSDELPRAERDCQMAARLEESLQSLDDQLVNLSGSAALDTFIDEAEAVDGDGIPDRLRRLADEIEQLEASRDELQRRIGQEENALCSLDCGDQAAQASETIQDLLAQLGGDAAKYVRVRLAAAILRDGIQRYQQRHEAPVLRRASELFQRLTLGSFARLVPDFGEGGEKVLMGDRGDGRPAVELGGMSDGTCDQLYLSLRLASLENFLADKEPVPFIIDDVLVGFDDQRSTAALEVLGEFSARTQIIFFTHHSHLVSLAEQALSGDVLFVHRLREG